MVGGDKENISILLAGFEDSTDSLVCGGDTLDGSLIHTSVANHIWGREIVHEKTVLLFRNSLRELLSDWSSTHLGVEVVCCDLRRRDHLSIFAGELLFNTAVEEEGDMSVLFRLRNVALLYVLLAKPFGQDVAHVLGWESDREWVVGLVLSHGCDVDVFRVREVRLWRAIDISEKLGYLPDTVGTIIEKEQCIVV
jgi:hypothetical protein